jgi:hypothetical protein
MRLILSLLLSSAVIAPVALSQTPTISIPNSSAPSTLNQRALVNDLALRLESDFVYPAQGKAYALALRAHDDKGDYDGLKGADLAKRLTEDLQAVAKDGHLRVMFEGMGGGPEIIIKHPPETQDGVRPQDGSKGEPKPIMIKVMPKAIEQAGWIAPGIAFVRFNGFPSEPDTVEAVTKFMNTYASAKTIIFDIRTHMGGALGEMDAIFPYLYGQKTHLLNMATRTSVDQAGGSPIAGVPTLKIVEGDHEFVTREHWVTPNKKKSLRKAKIYVLTSGFSASAAEHFASALKHTKRATLIGRTTYGANHFGGDQDLGNGFSVFLPVGRAYDPKTGKDWEGVGVEPDIDIAPEDALIKALTLSGVPKADAERLSAERAPQLPMRGRKK